MDQQDVKKSNADVNIRSFQGTQNSAKEIGTVLHPETQTNVKLKTSEAPVSSVIEELTQMYYLTRSHRNSALKKNLAVELILPFSDRNYVMFGDTFDGKNVRLLNTGLSEAFKWSHG